MSDEFELEMMKVLQRHLPKMPSSAASNHVENLQICLTIADHAYQISVIQQQPKKDITCLEEICKALSKAEKKMNALGRIGREAVQSDLQGYKELKGFEFPLGTLDPLAEYNDIPRTIRLLEAILKSAGGKIAPQPIDVSRKKHKNHAAESFTDACGDIYHQYTGRIPGRGSRNYDYDRKFEDFLEAAFRTVGITASAEDQARHSGKRFQERRDAEDRKKK